MRILVPTVRGGLDDNVAGMFARAPTFTLIDVDEAGNATNVQVIQNRATQVPRGAGIQVVQLCIDSGVNVVIAPNVGPNAAEALAQAGIKVIIASPALTVRQAIEAFLKGDLQSLGASLGMGRRLGRGSGRGSGRGWGRGGRGW